tara:strand:- start:341 stop:514 length:174 start_codon:yes stop_codon:yes gene_type:complete
VEKINKKINIMINYIMPICVKKSTESVREYHIRKWKQTKDKNLKEKRRQHLVAAGWL